MLDDFKSDLNRYRKYQYTGSLLVLFFRNQGLWAMLCYRVGRAVEKKKLFFPLNYLFKVFYFFWSKNIEIVTGIHFSTNAKIGPGLYVGHCGNIFVGNGCEIGENCNISQEVTLGLALRGSNWGVPKIGNRVYMAPGSKILGPIELGDGTVVGANAVLTKSTPPNAVMAGIPARLVSYEGSEKYIPFTGEPNSSTAKGADDVVDKKPSTASSEVES